jgi:hypothetical protein
MWKARLDRRELLEKLLSDRVGSPVNEVDSMFSFDSPLDLNQVLVFWRNDPSKSAELPVLIVVHDSKLVELLAIFASTPQLPSPITSFCRVISQTDLHEMSKFEVGPKDGILDGFVGLALAEVVLMSNGNLRVGDVGPAACKRALSFTFGRALLSTTPHFLPRVVDGWFSVQRLVNPYGNLDLMNQIGSESTGIFNIACEVFYGMAPSSNLSAICYEVLEFGEPSDQVWSELRAPLHPVPSLKTLASLAREERGLYLQQALRVLSSSKSRASDEEAAFCALLATRIAPGSFEHMNMLATFQDKRVLLWYGFFAALQRGAVALRGHGGLGMRVRRDLYSGTALSSVPLADISLSELSVISKTGVDALSRRLGHSNEIIVELCPLLDTSFRFGTKSDKGVDQSEVSDKQASMAFTDSSKSISFVEKIDLVRSLLAEISVGMKSVETSGKGKGGPRKK